MPRLRCLGQSNLARHPIDPILTLTPQTANDSEMRAHEAKSHHWVCKFGCGGQVYRNEEDLNEHLYQRHVKCEFCGLWCENGAALDLHVDADHPMCASCGQQFKTAHELQQHHYARVNHRCYQPKTSPGKSPKAPSSPIKTSTPNQSFRSEASFISPSKAARTWTAASPTSPARANNSSLMILWYDSV